MPQIQIDLNDNLNKYIETYQAVKSISHKSKAVLEILQIFFDSQKGKLYTKNE